MFKLIMLVTAMAFASPRIWFIHDLAKINPQSGKAYEAGDLYISHLPESHQKSNAVWNENKNNIAVRGVIFKSCV